MKRKIIKIDEKLCNGCGICANKCPEGAIKIIDGKANLISENYCDGLGACIGDCPTKAISIEERETVEYDEIKVINNIIQQGENRKILQEHLKHLKEHNEIGYLNIAIKYLKENNIDIPEFENKKVNTHSFNGCPGIRIINFENKQQDNKNEEDKKASELRQWPIQFHLITPLADYFKKADILLAADCVAYSIGNFHKDFLKGKKLIIACPKLDSEQNFYKEKLKVLIEEAKINTLTIMIMQVPCCQGLLNLAFQALNETDRKIPIKTIVVSLDGNILRDEWLKI